MPLFGAVAVVGSLGVERGDKQLLLLAGGALWGRTLPEVFAVIGWCWLVVVLAPPLIPFSVCFSGFLRLSVSL